MNVVVLNPVFLGAFLGTAFLAAAGGVVSFLPWVVPRSPLLFAAGLLYVVGCFFVTIRFNVPLNNRLARLEPDLPAAAAEWSTYLREWTAWNHVRTAASLASAGFSAAALAT